MSVSSAFTLSEVSFRIFRTILINNPLGIFVRTILAKWSMIVFVPSVIVTFWVFTGLYKAGVIDIAFRTVGKGLLETQAIAQHCTPKILDLPAMWECVQSPGQYVEHPEERLIRRRLRALEDPSSSYEDYILRSMNDPYMDAVLDDMIETNEAGKTKRPMNSTNPYDQ